MTYDFGYSPITWRLEFAGGVIVPSAGRDHSAQWIAKYAHRDGFIYPPMMQTVEESGEEIPNSNRPGLLFQLPPSHSLRLNIATDDAARGYASFVIHLLGYYFGGWYQFADWWFDARVPQESTHNIVTRRHTAEQFISHSRETWLTWPPAVQRRFTNILYMLNRAPSYEWDWEHFIVEYMVLDGCYRMARDLGYMQRDDPHPQRIKAMCNQFGIPEDDALIRKTASLRNDLFHETLWDKGQPGSSRDISSVYAPLYLRRLNQRLIPALLRYNTPYIGTSWWTLSQFSF